MFIYNWRVDWFVCVHVCAVLSVADNLICHIIYLYIELGVVHDGNLYVNLNEIPNCARRYAMSCKWQRECASVSVYQSYCIF